MPVVVTGASGLIGRPAVRAFVRSSPEVRAYIRRPETAGELRQLGAKVAVGRIDDVETLATVMAGAHTVCHLVGSLYAQDFEAEIEGTLRPVLSAAQASGVRRVLYLSYPGASAESPNPFLRSKGLAERMLATSGLEFAVVRCTHAYGSGSRWLQARMQGSRMFPSPVIGSGRQILAPLYVEDVAAVLAAADDREDLEPGIRGLEGPDRITADALTDLLSGRRARAKYHLPPTWGVVFGRSVREGPLAQALIDVLAADCLSDAPDAAAEFGVALTPLDEGLRRSLHAPPS